MVGETNCGTCLREATLWYGNAQSPCPMPLNDGRPCGDTGPGGARCPYGGVTKLDRSKLVFITYPQANERRD